MSSWLPAPALPPTRQTRRVWWGRKRARGGGTIRGGPLPDRSRDVRVLAHTERSPSTGPRVARSGTLPAPEALPNRAAPGRPTHGTPPRPDPREPAVPRGRGAVGPR